MNYLAYTAAAACFGIAYAAAQRKTLVVIVASLAAIACAAAEIILP